MQDLQEENERLRASLSELQESFESLQQKRQTGPEAALKKLQQTSDARVSSAHDLVEQYKREVEQLHATLSQSIPKGSKALNREIQQKDAELAKIKRELQSVRSNVAERDQTSKPSGSNCLCSAH